MAMSRNEDILQAIVDGTSSSELPAPQSREERLLHAILDKINEGGGGPGGTGLSIHICSSSEYDPLTGVPTISYPSETTFYLVPTGDGANDIYDEWVFVEGAWEHFGSGSHVAGETYTFSEGEVDGAFLVETSSGQQQSVKVHGLLPFCFSGNEDEIIFDSGSIDDDD